ncbi:MAG: YaaR family protein, partial [Tissierellia bacterium]|nr:YaaR family protein [Tissierellia bacterium]
MTRINRIGTENITAVEISRAVDRKAIKDTFKIKLNELEQEHIRTQLRALYDKIENLSNKLADKLFIEDLIEYKKLVKEFLRVAVNSS